MGYVREEHLKDLMDDGITYFGGFFTSPKISEKLDRKSLNNELICGLNLVDTDKFRVMTTLAYYIPTWEIAMEMFVKVMEKDRLRAIDVMIANECSIKKYFVYPAWFEENPTAGSDIRDGKAKFARGDYSFK
jgi:hypothetical protein